jgi:hypothetical protein
MAHSDGTAAMTSPGDNASGRRVTGNPDAVELYKVIYDEARRLLDDQLAELSTIRTRTVQYLAFIGTATAFLVGTSLSTGEESNVFWGLAASASLLLVAALLRGIQVLSGMFWLRPADDDGKKRRRFRQPEMSFHFGISKLVQQVDKPIDVKPANFHARAQLFKGLALQAEKYFFENESIVKRVKNAYLWCIGLGFLQLIIWGVVAWRYGGPPPS